MNTKPVKPIGIITSPSGVCSIYIQASKYDRFKRLFCYNPYLDKYEKDAEAKVQNHAPRSLSFSAWVTRERKVKTYGIYRITEEQLHERFPDFLVDALL